VIILIGVAGAGKSTQGRMLADEQGYAWISTGEILRVLITGKRRREMLEGKLLSDQEMIKTMDKVLDFIDIQEELVLDGFPRTVAQASWLIEQAKAGRFDITAVFHLSLSEKEARQRLKLRGRLDDTPEAIRQRFHEYHNVTLPILDCFKENNLQIYEINADQTAKTVNQSIIRCLPPVE
jgi:adenylate kinase